MRHRTSVWVFIWFRFSLVAEMNVSKLNASVSLIFYIIEIHSHASVPFQSHYYLG